MPGEGQPRMVACDRCSARPGCNPTRLVSRNVSHRQRNTIVPTVVFVLRVKQNPDNWYCTKVPGAVVSTGGMLYCSVFLFFFCCDCETVIFAFVFS